MLLSKQIFEITLIKSKSRLNFKMDPLGEFKSAEVPILWLSNGIKMMNSAPLRK